MIEVRVFKAEDLKNINEFHFGPVHSKSLLKDRGVERLEARPDNYSFLKDGRVLACAGVIQYWPGRLECWAIFDKIVKEDFVSLFKKMRHLLDDKLKSVNRIEAYVESDFENGNKFVKLLGFELECPLLKKYGVNGEDHSLWVKVRE